MLYLLHLKQRAAINFKLILQLFPDFFAASPVSFVGHQRPQRFRSTTSNSGAGLTALTL